MQKLRTQDILKKKKQGILKKKIYLLTTNLFTLTFGDFNLSELDALIDSKRALNLQNNIAIKISPKSISIIELFFSDTVLNFSYQTFYYTFMWLSSKRTFEIRPFLEIFYSKQLKKNRNSMLYVIRPIKSRMFKNDFEDLLY